MAVPLFFVPAVSISYRPSSPSPPMRRVISSMRSSGNGGSHRGFSAIDMSFMGLSSAAVRLELRAPQRRHRWMMAHSPPRRTQTATGSMIPPQSASRSPGSMSTCRLARQFGQWLRWLLPALSGVQSLPQTLQVKASLQAWFIIALFQGLSLVFTVHCVFPPDAVFFASPGGMACVKIRRTSRSGHTLR